MSGLIQIIKLILSASFTVIPELHKGCQTENFEEEEEASGNVPNDAPISVERLKDSPQMMNYYTGFEDFNHFMHVYQSLGPAAADLECKTQVLGPKDEFLLTLIKLRQDKDDLELGFLFGLSQHAANCVFKTWLNFLYHQFKKVELFQSNENMPEGSKKQLPQKSIILDAVGLAKNYKILANEYDHSNAPFGGRILFVCFVLSNFGRYTVAKLC